MVYFLKKKIKEGTGTLLICQRVHKVMPCFSDASTIFLKCPWNGVSAKTCTPVTFLAMHSSGGTRMISWWLSLARDGASTCEVVEAWGSLDHI